MENSIVFRAKDMASATIAKVAGHIDAMGRRAKNSGSVMSRAFSMMGTAALKLKSIVFGLNTALAALGAGFLVRNLNNTSSEFENLEIQLNALQGSAEAGRRAMAWVKEFALTTPLALQEVTRSFVTMRAFGLDPMDGSMLKLVDASSKLGGGAERLTSIVRAVGQMFTKGKIQAEEMNRQLTEVGVPAWDLLSKAMGKNVGELQDLASKGQLGRKEIKLLIEEIGKFGAGAALANMQTYTGLVSNLGDQLSQAKDSFTRAKNGLFDFTKALVGEGIDALTRFRQEGSLAKWGEGVAFSVLNVGRSFVATAKAVMELGELFSWIITPVKNGLGFVVLMAKLTKDAIEGLINATKRLGRTFRGELGEAFDPKPAEGFAGALDKILVSFDKIESRVKANTQKSLGEQILSEAQSKIPKKPGTDKAGPEVQVPAKFDQEMIISSVEFEVLAAAAEFAQMEGALRRHEQEIFNTSREFEALAAEAEFAHMEGALQRQGEFQERKGQMIAEAAQMRIKIAEDEAEAVRRAEEMKIKAQQVGLGMAMTLANTAAAFSSKNSKAMFFVTRTLMTLQAIASAKAASALALANPPGPPTTAPYAALVLKAGLLNAASIAAMSFAPGARGGGGSSLPAAQTGVGFSGSPFADKDNPQNTNQPIFNIEIKTNDAKSFLDNAREVKRELTEMVAEVQGNGGNTGQFQLVSVRD